MYVGNNGTGSFSQTGGSVNLPSLNVAVGNNPGSSGSYSLSGSGVLNLNCIVVGNSSTGSFSLSQNAQSNLSSQLYIGAELGAPAF